MGKLSQWLLYSPRDLIRGVQLNRLDLACSWLSCSSAPPLPSFDSSKVHRWWDEEPRKLVVYRISFQGRSNLITRAMRWALVSVTRLFTYGRKMGLQLKRSPIFFLLVTSQLKILWFVNFFFKYRKNKNNQEGKGFRVLRCDASLGSRPLSSFIAPREARLLETNSNVEYG